MKLAHLTVTAVAVLVLTSCTDDPQPKVAPSGSASSSGAMPNDSKPHEREIQFIESIVNEFSDSLSTGDATRFLAMTDRRCANCRRLVSNLRSAYRDGGRIEGGGWEVLSVKAAKSEGAGTRWNVNVHTNREEWFDARGALVQSVAAATVLFGFAIEERVGESLILRNLKLRS